MKTIACIAFSLFFVSVNGVCQSKNKVGIAIIIENIAAGSTYINNNIQKIPISKMAFVPAISYERKLTNRSSIEVELRFKQTMESNFMVPPPESPPAGWYFYTHNYVTKETVINLSVCYKFNSKIINFSAGPTIEYLLDTKQLNVNPYSTILGKEAYPKKWSVGVMTKISKTIKVNKYFAIEPSLFFNPILSYSKNYLGLALTANYIF